MLTELRLLDTATALGIWSLTETEAELLAQAPAWLRAGGIPERLTHPRRRCEWLAGRVLATALLGSLTDATTADQTAIVPDAFGRPRLAHGGGAVALSHGGEAVAALVALGPGRRVGLDLEPVRAKALTLAPRFLTEPELAAVGDDVRRASLAWGLKEVLYKAYGRRQLDFRQHLALDLHLWPSPPEPLPLRGTVTGQITQPGTGHQWPHTLHYEVGPAGWLTYCVSGVV